MRISIASHCYFFPTEQQQLSLYTALAAWDVMAVLNIKEGTFVFVPWRIQGIVRNEERLLNKSLHLLDKEKKYLLNCITRDQSMATAKMLRLHEKLKKAPRVSQPNKMEEKKSAVIRPWAKAKAKAHDTTRLPFNSSPLYSSPLYSTPIPSSAHLQQNSPHPQHKNLHKRNQNSQQVGFKMPHTTVQVEKKTLPTPLPRLSASTHHQWTTF